MISEACLMFGWSAEECFSMPATRFFALVHAGRRIEFDRTNAMLADLCDIAAIPLANSKYCETTKGHFRSRISGFAAVQISERIESEPALLDGDAAKQAIFSIFGAAKRFV